ncbi:MAG: RsbRD N-terminal domain-containing protein [Blastocatellia bacterium]
MTIPNLADLVQAHHLDIAHEWIEAVRHDPRIHSDDGMSDSGLRDHVPFMIEEICNLLRTQQTPQAANTREGRVHVYTRYRLGYRPRDLVCEISLLRMILLDHLEQGMLSAQTGGLKTYVEATRIINRYIDEELRYAISVYTEAETQSQLPDGTEQGAAT